MSARTYLIELARAGHYGATETRVVQGTHVSIERGRLMVWDEQHGPRPVATFPLERLVTLKGRELAAHAVAS